MKGNHVPSPGCVSIMVVSTFDVVRACVKSKIRFGDLVAIAGL